MLCGFAESVHSFSSACGNGWGWVLAGGSTPHRRPLWFRGVSFLRFTSGMWLLGPLFPPNNACVLDRTQTSSLKTKTPTLPQNLSLANAYSSAQHSVAFLASYQTRNFSFCFVLFMEAMVLSLPSAFNQQGHAYSSAQHSVAFPGGCASKHLMFLFCDAHAI